MRSASHEAFGVHRSINRYLFPVFSLALALGTTSAAATAQQTDHLIIDGESASLQTNPLAPLLREGGIELPEPAEEWTSNWRGYVATWHVASDQLVLAKVEVLLRPADAPEKSRAVATDVLPMLFEGKSEVPASWYSGTLVIPRGEVVNYVHMGYASTHERYTVLQVTRGRIDSRRELSAAEYEVLRKERFAKFKLTPEYARLMEELSPGSSVIETEEFLYEYAVEEYMSVAQ